MDESLIALKKEMGQLTGILCDHREIGLGSSPLKTELGAISPEAEREYIERCKEEWRGLSLTELYRLRKELVEILEEAREKDREAWEARRPIIPGYAYFPALRLRAMDELISEIQEAMPPPIERIVTCRYCGAIVKLIGLPPGGPPGTPEIMLHYPMQYCPQCGAEIGRARRIELISMAPWHIKPVPIIRTIICAKCGSELKVTLIRYIYRPLMPATPETKYCPICNEPIPLATTVTSTVEVVRAEPWPKVAVEPEEPKMPWKPILIFGSALGILSLVIVGYKKFRR